MNCKLLSKSCELEVFKDDTQLDDFFGLKPENHENSKKDRNSPNTGLKDKVLLAVQLLSKRERYLILALGLTVLASIIATPISVYIHFTKASPTYGGHFTEGLVGEPRYINPLLSRSNDTDRDLVSLIYSGLMKYNQTGKLVPDLIKSYEISDDGLNYTVYLKENLKWHDGTRITTDDIIFTIQTAQNSDYGSPERINWQGVDAEKINDYGLIFKLKNKYAQFLNNLTIRILPKHLWQDIKPINFAFSELNLKPIGSGPYKFKKFKKDRNGQIISYELESYKNYHEGQPYIDKMEFKFYDSEETMINNYNENGIDNLSFVSPKNFKKVKFKQRLNVENLKMPRYFAVFFNQNQSKLLSDKNIRVALNYATDKEALIKKILDGNGTAIDGPLSEATLELKDTTKKYPYEVDKAKETLKTAGWDTLDEKGIRKKKDKRLSLKLATSSWPELVDVANTLKEQWAQAGIELDIEIMQTPELQQVIKDRDYQILLFGEILTVDPDPFSLWHSSQKRDPGLNLALYDNKTADTLLEEARQTLNTRERMKKYEEFQKIIVEDVPAVFLYNPYYLYLQAKKIKGLDSKLVAMPSDRFSEINKWYIETKRTWR